MPTERWRGEPSGWTVALPSNNKHRAAQSRSPPQPHHFATHSFNKQIMVMMMCRGTTTGNNNLKWQPKHYTKHPLKRLLTVLFVLCICVEHTRAARVFHLSQAYASAHCIWKLDRKEAFNNLLFVEVQNVYEPSAPAKRTIQIARTSILRRMCVEWMAAMITVSGHITTTCGTAFIVIVSIVKANYRLMY